MKSKIVSLFSMDPLEMPKIVTFQNGELKPSKAKKLKCTALHDTKSGNNHLSVSSSKLNYVGRENTDNDLCHTLLAIRNKTTNKIRLVPVSTISLNVHIVNSNDLLKSTLENRTVTQRELSRQFGSKTAKRKIEQYEKFNMNVSNVDAELKSVVNDVSVSEETVDLNQDRTYIPPMNRNASTVDHVFDIDTFLSEEEIASYNDLLGVILDGVSLKPDTFCDFSRDCIKVIPKYPENRKRIALFLYVDAIIKYFKKPCRFLNQKKYELPPHPKPIIDKILKEFSVLVGQKRTRPMSFRDKGLCYAIAMSLIGLDYKVNLLDLAESSGISLKKLQVLARALGLEVLPRSDRGVAVLKLPLLEANVSSPKKGRKT